MTSKKTNAAEQQPKTDLAANYRPLGLKAVAAASLMAKKKPAAAKKSA